MLITNVDFHPDRITFYSQNTNNYSAIHRCATIYNRQTIYISTGEQFTVSIVTGEQMYFRLDFTPFIKRRNPRIVSIKGYIDSDQINHEGKPCDENGTPFTQEEMESQSKRTFLQHLHGDKYTDIYKWILDNM